jgi:hypothetical protein
MSYLISHGLHRTHGVLRAIDGFPAGVLIERYLDRVNGFGLWRANLRGFINIFNFDRFDRYWTQAKIF